MCMNRYMMFLTFNFVCSNDIKRLSLTHKLGSSSGRNQEFSLLILPRDVKLPKYCKQKSHNFSSCQTSNLWLVCTVDASLLAEKSLQICFLILRSSEQNHPAVLLPDVCSFLLAEVSHSCHLLLHLVLFFIIEQVTQLSPLIFQLLV